VAIESRAPPARHATQEPLFNDTTFRYDLLRSQLAAAVGEHSIDDAAAVRIAATLGKKGPDFHSCDPAQFGHGEHVLSVVYAPRDVGATRAASSPDVDAVHHDPRQPGDGDAHAWVAWEDASPSREKWTPAACNPYVRIDLAGFFG